MRGQARTDAVDEQTAKKPKKLEKNSDTRMLDPWERYRALVDTQVVARVTDAKFKALERLYNGLTAMTSLSAVMVAGVALYRLIS